MFTQQDRSQSQSHPADRCVLGRCPGKHRFRIWWRYVGSCRSSSQSGYTRRGDRLPARQGRTGEGVRRGSSDIFCRAGLGPEPPRVPVTRRAWPRYPVMPDLAASGSPVNERRWVLPNAVAGPDRPGHRVPARLRRPAPLGSRWAGDRGPVRECGEPGRVTPAGSRPLPGPAKCPSRPRRTGRSSPG